MTEMSKWISIKDKLPTKDFTHCFALVPEICGRYESIHCVYYEGTFYRKIRHEYDRYVDIAIKPDYWIEIPEIPIYEDEND